MKTCSRCGKNLPLTAFHKEMSNKKNGRVPYCRDCKKVMAAEYRANNPAGERARFWKRKGILGSDGQTLTYEEYLHTLERQGNACAICERPVGTDAHADHDHTTGRFRGVLCRFCNTHLIGGYEMLPADKQDSPTINRYLYH